MVHINFEETIFRPLDDIGIKLMSYSKLWLIWFTLIQKIVIHMDFQKLLTEISIWNIDVLINIYYFI